MLLFAVMLYNVLYLVKLNEEFLHMSALHKLRCLEGTHCHL